MQQTVRNNEEPNQQRSTAEQLQSDYILLNTQMGNENR